MKYEIKQEINTEIFSHFKTEQKREMIDADFKETGNSDLLYSSVSIYKAYYPSSTMRVQSRSHHVSPNWLTESS